MNPPDEMRDGTEDLESVSQSDVVYMFVHAWQTLFGDPSPSDTYGVARAFDGFCELHGVVPADRNPLWEEITYALGLVEPRS